MLLTRFALLGSALCLILISCVSASELVGAARQNDAGLVVELLRSGADANERGEQSAVALHWAAYHGNPDLVRALLDAGSDVDAMLENGSTPLHLAAHRGHTGIVRLLLSGGANPLARNLEGVTPIGWARRNGRAETVRLLAAAKPDAAKPDAAKPGSKPAAKGGDAGPSRNTVPQTSAEAIFRVQLVAVSSEQRAREVIERYRERFAAILQDTDLVFEAVAGTQPGLYRVQSVPVSGQRARDLCKQLQQRDQACLLRRMEKR